MNYRSIPLTNGYSSAELLMDRKIKTKITIKSNKLLSEIINQSALRNWKAGYRSRQKCNFDKQHSVRNLQELFAGDDVTEGSLPKQKLHV